MEWTSIATVVYGVLVMAGGVMGYLKASSLASLLMGSLSGLTLLVGGVILYKTGAEWAFWLIGAVTILLMGFFGYRFALSHKFMPAGIMAIFSLVMLLILFFQKGSR